MLLFVLTALGLQASGPDSELYSAADSVPALVEAYEAWAAGNLPAAGEAAALAMARLESDRCSISPDGARLAWILGVAARFEVVEAPAGYWFWAAQRIAHAAGGLDQYQRRVVRRLATEPGDWATSDAWYAHSAYLGSRLAAQDCGAPERILVDPAAGAGDAAYVILEVRTNHQTRVRRAKLELAYPPQEGGALRDAVTGHHLTTGLNANRAFVFDPCTELRDEAGELIEVCRISQRD
ncbi:hypothetical protein ACWCOP_05590 [Maricaulaceae bacterium MS644]